MPLRVGGEDVEANWRGGGGEGVADIWVSCMTIYRIGRGEQTREKVIVQELLSPRSSDRPIKKPLLWPRQATLDGRGCRRAQFWNYATQEPSRPSSFYPWWEDILHCRTRIVSLGMGWIHSIMISSVRCNEKQTISNDKPCRWDSTTKRFKSLCWKKESNRRVRQTWCQGSAFTYAYVRFFNWARRERERPNMVKSLSLTSPIDPMF